MNAVSRSRGLVLGGGGVTGIAWMTGLLLGLSEEGVDLREADHMLGTSAGSAVGAQISSGVPLDELFRHQTDPALQVEELQPLPNLLANVMETLPRLMHVEDAADRMSAIGALAMTTVTVEESVRRSSIAGRLPVHCWPDQGLSTVAVDIGSGEVTLFDQSSGVDLIDAVAASCAVPGLWPPVTIGQERYMDGGVRSSDNADLAGEYELVIVISPLGAKTAKLPGGGLASQVEERDRAGLRTYVIEPDDAVRKAMGHDPFDAEKRAPTAHAGRLQGRSLGKEIEAFWGESVRRRNT